ncbi:MAG: hypothetical protein AMXMBFR13_10580 [Phycisphaerae bacterium]
MKDLAHILDGWPVGHGEPRVRKFTAGDGTSFLQVRVDLGVLQLAVDGRPDGDQPHGYDSMLECLADQVRQYKHPLNISPTEWQALMREVLQFYRRRVTLMTLAQQAQEENDLEEAAACYVRAIRDANHNLAILDFLRDSCTGVEDLDDQESYRPYILMHRAMCEAQHALLEQDPDEAIEALKAGIAAIKGCSQTVAVSEDGESERMDVRPFVAELRRMEKRVRKQYSRRRTVREQLEDALAHEDYERAAKLRDFLAEQGRRHKRV